MKKVAATLVVAALSAACNTANAQSSPTSSSVTLYGVLMGGVIYTNNSISGKSYSTANGPSRWGMRGVEDLGGGLRSIFTLEGGFNPNTGSSSQGGREFGRQAFVGVQGDHLGTVTFGRQYDLTQDWLAQYSTPYRWNGYTAHVGDNDNFNFQFRTNNTVKYVSPSFSGLQFGAMYSFGGVAGSFGNQGAASFGATYANGPLSLSAAYMRMNHPASAASEGIWTTTLYPSVSANSPLTAYAVTPSSMEIYGAGGSYKIGETTLGLVATHSRYDDLGIAALGLSRARAGYTNIEGNVSHFFTPAYQANFAYTYTTGKIEPTGFSPKYHQFNLINNYFLSKRTALYLVGIFQLAAGDAQHANIEYASGGGASTTKRQVAITAGIFHRF
ncbi:porin [Chitinasiproducens palmae]|uniref:Outer membrane protein (Porin) n=1 Tax=Chitinasiproducens palmae TaxID=1770053 RepID=A0A1H2PVA7_9BURK|nr:porin [Chitinasiproducens palmae]SDV51185.1 Outer membrane protein (porin) [Chitinasiproducens palmae]